MTIRWFVAPWPTLWAAHCRPNIVSRMAYGLWPMVLGAALGTVMSGSAYAAHSSPPVSTTMSAIMKLHSEHFLLKQEVANALLRHQLHKLEAGGAGSGANPYAPPARGAASTAGAARIGKTLPRIRSIFGTGTRFRAVLEARNGAVLSVHGPCGPQCGSCPHTKGACSGSFLPGGLVVRRITSRAVWVSLGARSRLLFLHWVPAHKQQSAKFSGGGYLPNAALRNLLLNPSSPLPSSVPTQMGPPPPQAGPVAPPSYHPPSGSPGAPGGPVPGGG